MFEMFRPMIAEWNRNTSDRQKLQQSYVVLLVVVIFVAGVVSLFNGDYSHRIMLVALALVTTFIINLVAWNLLQEFVFDKLPRQARTRTTKRR